MNLSCCFVSILSVVHTVAPRIPRARRPGTPDIDYYLLATDHLAQAFLGIMVLIILGMYFVQAMRGTRTLKWKICNFLFIFVGVLIGLAMADWYWPYGDVYLTIFMPFSLFLLWSGTATYLAILGNVRRAKKIHVG